MYAILCVLSGDYLYIGTSILLDGFIFSEEVRRGVTDVTLAFFSSKEEAESILHKNYWRKKGSTNNTSFIILDKQEIDLTTSENRSLFEIVKL